MAELAAASHSLWLIVEAVLLLPVAALWLADREAHRAKVRTWAAIVLTSSVAWVVLPTQHGVSFFGAAMLLDLSGGFATILRPAGRRQFAIGATFALMALFNIGWALGGAQQSTWPWWAVQTGAGWLQMAILIEWTGADAGKAIFVRFRRWWRRSYGAPVFGRAGR